MEGGAASSKGTLPLARVSVLVVVLLAPMVVLSATPWSANSSLWFLGMLPAVMGLFSGPRLALGAAFLTPTWMGVALLLRDLPAAGSLYMAAIGAAVGLSALRGWHVMGSFAAPLAAFALIGAPHVALPSGTVPAESTPTAVIAATGFVAAGGLWTTLVGSHLSTVLPFKPPAVVPLHTARYFALSLAALAGAGTFIAMRWSSSPDAWWIVLTIFVVVQPYYAAATQKVVARVAGTVAGALLAIAVAEVLQDQPVIVTVIALALTLAAPWANLTRPYWVFVLFLTPAVVLQTAGGSEAIVTSALDRAVYTVGGSLAAIVVLTIGHAVIIRRHAVPAADSRNAPAEDTTT